MGKEKGVDRLERRKEQRRRMVARSQWRQNLMRVWGMAVMERWRVRIGEKKKRKKKTQRQRKKKQRVEREMTQ